MYSQNIYVFPIVPIVHTTPYILNSKIYLYFRKPLSRIAVY